MYGCFALVIGFELIFFEGENGTWVIYGNLTVTNTTVDVPLVIVGELILMNNSILTITSNTTIFTSECVHVLGGLIFLQVAFVGGLT